MPKPKIFRVIDTAPQSGKVQGYITDRLLEMDWVGTLPRIGDIYRLDTAGPVLIGQAEDPRALLAPSSDVLRWRTPQANGLTRMEVLRRRATARTAIRAMMDQQDFLEIEVPLLVHGVIPDAALHSFAVEDRFLVTTTENQLKRLETGGFDRIYSFTKNFREGDTTSPYRNPEFTMIEWARVGEPYESIEEDAQNIFLAAHKALGGGTHLVYQDRTIDLTTPWEKASVKTVVERHTGYALKNFSTAELRQALEASGQNVRADWAEDKSMLFTLLMDHIQPCLGQDRPIFVNDWPAFQTSMALEHEDGETAYRSELYVAGIELADGFPALTSYARQRETFERQQQRRREEGLPEAAVDHAYLAALRDGLPSESSMALGFDRLVMLITNQPHIKSVLSFSWDE